MYLKMWSCCCCIFSPELKTCWYLRIIFSAYQYDFMNCRELSTTCHFGSIIIFRILYSFSLIQIKRLLMNLWSAFQVVFTTSNSGKLSMIDIYCDPFNRALYALATEFEYNNAKILSLCCFSINCIHSSLNESLAIFISSSWSNANGILFGVGVYGHPDKKFLNRIVSYFCSELFQYQMQGNNITSVSSTSSRWCNLSLVMSHA